MGTEQLYLYFTHAVASATPHITFLDSALLHPGIQSPSSRPVFSKEDPKFTKGKKILTKSE